MSKKRPDYSWQLRPAQIPIPAPQWIKYLPDGMPCPNIVLEVAVNDESPGELLRYADLYFSPMSSIRLWIGVKVWVNGKKFWVGWGERAASGFGAIIHTDMQWPPNHHPIHTPINLTYSIPIQLVFGPVIPIPATAPNALEIDVDAVRRTILEVLG